MPSSFRLLPLTALATAILLLLALLPATGVEAQEPTAYEGAGLVGQSEEIYDALITEVLQVPTDHGTLYGEVIRPVTPPGVTVPVILTYSPYNVIGQAVTLNGSIADDSTAAYYAPRGYARAVFDVIGTRNSGGCYDYGGFGERETGAELVDFLGTREWSNGRVGMIGGSYDGTTQWAAAVEQPEHLTTIVPQVAIDRWYDYAFGGGIRYFLNNENPTDEGFDTPLAFDFGFGFLPSPDPARQGPDLFIESLQGSLNPCDRVENSRRAYEFDPVYDEFWVERDYERVAHHITASVMVEGGWGDHNVKHWDSTRMFMALADDLPRHLVMGQWRHSGNQHEDAQDLRHAWFDHWLLGLDTGIETLPLVDTQTDGTDVRHAEEAWPPATVVAAAVPLQLGESVPTAGDAAPAYELVLTGAEEPTWGESDPPTTEEEIFSGQASPRGTYLHFLGAPVDDEVRIAGSPTLRLDVTTDGGSTHFTPVLYEAFADGSTAVITRGFLNARNRNGLHVSTEVVSGEPYTAAIEMWDVDYTLSPGSRIGLAVASGNADWVLPDDDPQGTNVLAPGGSIITLPIAAGHQVVGVAEQFAPVVDRLAGVGRVQTAVAVSADSFPAADTVVVATAEDYPDALTAGPLAAALEAPLLLSGGTSLTDAVADEIARLGATDAVLVGGPAALDEQVADDLRALGVTVERIEGASRFATAGAVADRLAAVSNSGGHLRPIVVEGANADGNRGWPDAVSAAPLAAFQERPILLVTTDDLPADTAAALQRLGSDAATIVGGESAVSEAVADAIAQRVGGTAAVERIAGASRYATSAAVHAEMVAAGMDGSVLWLATGRDWPDALAAGPAVAAAGQTFALIDGRDAAGSPQTLDLVGPSVSRVRLMGGPAAISAEVQQRIAAGNS